MFDKKIMADQESTGSILRRIWQRSGYSMKELAIAAGYTAASGIQRYVDATFNGRLSIDVATRFADALEGRGSPAITRSEIMALTGFVVQPNAKITPLDTTPEKFHPKPIPIYGTALGAPTIVEAEPIEQTELNTGEIIGYVKRPAALAASKDAYALYVVGSSMYPRYGEGEMLFAEPKRPPRIGDDVVVYMRANGQGDLEDNGERIRGVLIKRLVRRSATYIELEQFNPGMSFRLDVDDVVRIDRVIPLIELFG